MIWKGERAVKTLKKWRNEKLIELGDSVVLVKDEEGKVKIHDADEFTTKKGVVAGGIAGFAAGLIVGGPIGGILLGAAAGATTAKGLGMHFDKSEIEAVSESMENASSAICVEIKSVKNKDMLAAAIRESGGKVHELSVTDALESDMEDVMLRGSIR
jgi:uncharacterized membrane protein